MNIVQQKVCMFLEQFLGISKVCVLYHTVSRKLDLPPPKRTKGRGASTAPKYTSRHFDKSTEEDLRRELNACTAHNFPTHRWIKNLRFTLSIL
jgi:hypothetical protein